jgi:outer membrane protein assembly factor BamA
MPFGKKFYSGGANSLRAWQIRSLGPGAYRDTISLIPNQTGDIRLELNMEYRTKLFWMLESAVFLDMGNIWNMYKSEQVPNGHFLLKEFYKQFAVGTGFGLRFDFSFFIFRADIGLKLRDPSLADGNKWIFSQRFFNKDDLNVSLSIGYPF